MYLCRGYQQGVPSPMRITRPSVHKTSSSIRCSVRTHARPSTAAASKTEIASRESIRGRATTAVEYGSGLERTERRRAQGHCPPPDARTRARAFNAPDASPPNTRVTGGVIGNRLLSHRSFCSLPTERPRACQDAGNKDGTSNRDPLRHPRSALQISTPRTASDPQLHQAPSWRRVGRRLTTP